MTRRLTWSCDRCGVTIRVPERIDVDHGFELADEFSPGLDPRTWTKPPDWLVVLVDETAVADVCPACVTPLEHVDRTLADADRMAISAMVNEDSA